MAPDRLKVHVEYYAMLREEAGVSEESVETTSRNAADLYDELRQRHGFALDRSRLKLVVNEEFSEWSHEIHEGDTVVFIPPVAGG